jgi:hypothetical protein
MKTPLSVRIFCTFSLLALAGTAQAQSSCSSDQQPAPSAVLERFISADCDTCWANSKLAQPAKGQTALDWIVPSPRGDDAALSAAATNDATARLQSLALAWTASKPDMQASALLKMPAPAAKPPSAANAPLRVAHGLPFNGYIGTSIEFKPSPQQRQKALAPIKLPTPNASPELWAYTVLVETLPAGTEGSNIERNLVRNVLITPWNMREQLSKPKQLGFKPLFESRPMSIPQSSNPERLKVIGWVQDANGRVLAAAQSRCAG